MKTPAGCIIYSNVIYKKYKTRTDRRYGRALACGRGLSVSEKETKYGDIRKPAGDHRGSSKIRI